MAEVFTVRAATHRVLVTKVNVVKRLDIAIKGLENDIDAKKKSAIADVASLFTADMAGDDSQVYSNFKIECTKVAVVDGVEVEVPDGVVQCQMKVVRKELTEAETALVTAAGPETMMALTAGEQLVDLVDPARVLRWLVANPTRVQVTGSGSGLSIKLIGSVVGVDGVSMRSAVLPADKFLDKVKAMAVDRRVAAREFINAVLGRMLEPVLVIGNRTSTGAAGD